MSERVHDQLYATVKNFFEESTSGNLTTASVATLTRYAMQVVQTDVNFQGMKGSEKKDLVVGVVTALITDLLNDSNLDDSTKQSIIVLLATVPSIIDMAVDFGKVYHNSQSSGDSHQRSGFFCCF